MCSPGKYVSGIGSIFEGNCTLCSPGKYSSGSGFSTCGTCTSTLDCRNGSKLSLCSSSFDGYCYPLICPPGFFGKENTCIMCNNSRCNIGFYRGQCSETSDSVCLPCTNMPAGNKTLYVSAGQPADTNNCKWVCKPACDECNKV